MATFRHFQMPAESRARSSTPQSRQTAPSRRTPVELPAIMTTVSEDLMAGHFTARFNNPSVQPGAAHISRFIMPPPGTFYVPFKTQNFIFSHTTTEMAEKLGDKAFNTDYEELSSPEPSRVSPHPEDRPAKRSCMRKDKKTIRTRLNVMRPVKNAEEVALDAWRLILGQTTPDFLLEARTVCKTWNSLLEEETIWLRARIEKYGEDSPDPPKGISERKYADLLAGKGCQNSACPKVNTIKVFWAFRTRMCEECFKERTIKEDAAAKVYGPLVSQHNLLELLPSGVIRSGKYRGTRQWHAESQTWLQNGNKLLYLCSDVGRIALECASRIADGSTDGATDAWRARKIEEARSLMKQTAAIEEWERQLHLDAPDIRGARKSFFEMKALELSPPMPPEVLHMMQAYHTAISSRRPPSEKCWIQLRSKVLRYRAEAERLGNYQRQAESFSRDNVPDIDRFTLLHSHRFARGHGRRELLHEQQYVLNLARKELLRCQNSTPPVADEDLVLLTLRNVFKKHDQKPLAERPCGLNADAQTGPLVLTLDDARLIVEEVFECDFGEDPRRSRAVLEGFRCKGCSRQDCTRKYRFVELFKHIYLKHAHRVGEGYHFDYFARPFPPYGIESSLKFPWYTTNWPRNLPIAASHQEVNSDETWSPDAKTGYVQLARPSNVLAFAGRAAHKTDLEYDDFLGNLTHAAVKLKNTALEKELQTRIFLQYALDLWQRSPKPSSSVENLVSAGPTLEEFVDAMMDLRRVNPSLSLRYRCGACVKARGSTKGARFVKNPVDFHALLEHWNKKHSELNWSTDLLDLPSDREVLDQIFKADEELEQNKADLRAREVAKVKNPRKKGNAKATVVLAMYNGMEVFDHLFDKTI